MYSIKKFLKPKTKEIKQQNIYLLDAKKYIDKFNVNDNFSKEHIKNAVESLIQSISRFKDCSESYAYLSYCMYVLDQDKIAIQYLKKSLSINPELELAIKIQENIGKVIEKPKKKLDSHTESNVKVETQEKLKVKKIQRIKRLGE